MRHGYGAGGARRNRRQYRRGGNPARADAARYCTEIAGWGSCANWRAGRGDWRGWGAATLGAPQETPLLLPGSERRLYLVDEAQAKARLARVGLDIPRSIIGTDPDGLAFPLVLKGLGQAHKSEAGLIALGQQNRAEVKEAAGAMQAESYLLEEMIEGAVAELLVGVTRDGAHGFVLTLGAGGTLTQLLGDRVSLLVPAGRDAVEHALNQLRMAPLLHGYRSAKVANIAAILDAVDTVQAHVLANGDRVGKSRSTR